MHDLTTKLEHPTHKRMMQQCRNASIRLEEEWFDARFLIRDRDVVYPERMKQFWKSEGVTVIKTPVRAPKANAFCENFNGTIKKECLKHFTCFSRGQLNIILLKLDDISKTLDIFAHSS